jgi:hypothetical protein
MINQLILLPDMTKLKVEQKMKVEGEIHYHSICNSKILLSPTLEPFFFLKKCSTIKRMNE